MSTAPVPAAAPMRGTPLGEMVRALTASLVHPPDHAWREHLSNLLEPLRAAFTEHRVATEGARGIYADVVGDAPRLAHTVDGLVAEHSRLDRALTSLARAAKRTDADAEAIRAIAVKMLGDLDRHRQHDADLVYEAYATDIGGE
jgi:predicted RNA polymerase sigma factor